MKNKLKKVLKGSLKFFLGICVFSIASFIGAAPKIDPSLTTPHSELISDISSSKKTLTKTNEEISKAKAQKEDLEKQLNDLNNSLKKTNESIDQLESSNSN
ncbi:hypothetical protein [Clostridium sp. LIBA-8841]|uniref:coiled-coil domain-containing protein n=1 Tax=Clostridium sp. LIBA-8841 TaxID=2987530 RepID=UPI002AC7C4A4|nr:hypothetical protein [Clostridium sp. LIBA-8841]MDZ5253622.1 hypothetical protein [Clostridium sp. LIBA-8841]